MNKHYLVTGGTGFIGSGVVKALLKAGHKITILDDNSRGRPRRLEGFLKDVRMVDGDVRNPQDVMRATEGVDGVMHLAYVNGTEFFYSKPEVVLDVGVKGMVNILDACLHHKVRELVLASSSEVYQTPPMVPTPETVPLIVPDPMNPRYSYGSGKIISEMMTLHYGAKFFDRSLIFRPHNVFGEDMGWEHVIPQFALRMGELTRKQESGTLKFPIQGTGKEQRSFVYIDDFVDGLMTMINHGEHMNIYNIGTSEEKTMADVAHLVGKCFDRTIELAPGPEAKGGTQRRCPDITKLSALGYKPKWTLEKSLPKVVKWYDENRDKRQENA
mgnify:CR=1 FL=1